MKTMILVTTLAIAMASGASATNRDRTVNNNTAVAGAAAGAVSKSSASARQLQGQAQGQSQVLNNNTAASSAIAPGVGGGGGCNVGIGIGATDLIHSGSIGISWLNIPCEVRREAAMLYNMGLKREAVAHLAMWHKRVGKTLRSTGAVVSPGEATTSTRSAVTSKRPVARPVAYTHCRMEEGTIHVGVQRGAPEDVRARAISQCRDVLN